jgi:hypothetical protein
MSPRADHADTIIAVADVRRRRSSRDHHIAAGPDGQAGQQPGVPGETDAYPEPGTTTGHNGDPPVSIPPARYRRVRRAAVPRGNAWIARSCLEAAEGNGLQNRPIRVE